MDLTIIIPHYNSEKTLYRLIDSIPENPNIEIIIIDDKSETHNLEKRIKKYNRKNLIFSYNTTEKKGAGNARNIGINLAKGKWLLFADADDYFLDDFYKKVAKFFYSNYDVVYFTPISVDSLKNTSSNRHSLYQNLIMNYKKSMNKQAELKLKYSFYPPWSKLIRRKFLLDNKIFFDTILASNDIMFSTKLGHHIRFFYASLETIYVVVKTKGSLTMNTSLSIFESRLLAHIRYCTYLRKHLNKSDLKVFDLRGTGFLISVIKYRLGIKTFIRTVKMLRSAKIKILYLKLFNPVHLIYKLFSHYNNKKENSNYYTK